jgi:hypothetical protein
MPTTRVIFLPSPHMTTCQAWSALKRKRRTLWHHTARNLLVARVAAACRARDRKVLKEMGVPHTRRKGRAGAARVAVLVESTEHARALGALLPGWEVLDAVPTLGAEEEPQDEDGGEEARTASAGRVLTWMRAFRHWIRADVLVRATGWRGRLGLDPWEEWVRPSGGVLVIDFDDAWDGRAEADTEARVREYEAQGLQVVRSDGGKTATA